MKKLLYIYNYCVYRLKAGNEHSVHSPFVFDLLTKVIYNRVEYYAFKKIENLRKQVLDSKIVIARPTQKSAKCGQLLFRLVNYFQPSQILEIGTWIGINTAYLASVSSKLNVLTIEDDKEKVEIAKRNFEQLELKNITQLINNSEDTLPIVLSKSEHLDLVYFSGNLNKQVLLNYFNLCLEKANGNSVFIFEDVYMSPEMKEAWNEIKDNNRVRVTIDLFFIGIVFFRQEQMKQHFIIKL